CMQVLQTPFTL
nr:immunoglobulin light chain junction region [Macaca mulatta]MPN91654.1 immunoglobulin light chain junction region [Macaca mulatta]MPN92555.1 immunoglobulin light chain junction region [Macaca mulatta]MPN93914.1 immunoglobulin light chain junction region [Macaca mulatta]MPN94571.1 immunoglobulin light chain junction region [Macaca mulatta]